MAETTGITSQMQQEDITRAYAAFDTLFRTHMQELIGFAYAIVRNKSQAEDIVQDIFVKVWRNRHVINDDMNVRAYLYIAVKHACFDFLRTEKLRNRKSGVGDDLSDSISPEFITLSDNAELRATLLRAIKCLSPRQQEIIRLLLDGLRNKEIAQVLTISEDNVGQQISRALVKLREEMKKLPGGELYFMILVSLCIGNTYTS